MSQVLPTDPLWPQVGQSLGPWLILRHHDLEGSGDMFLAKRRDGAFEREVLITLQTPTPPGTTDDGNFLVERELQGRLDHPGIAKVLGAGRTQSGLPYLVTEYLDGPHIEQHLDAIRCPVTERIRYFQQVCEAVQHAHEKKICGLNLQASNVHLIPDGSMRIVVFGLAQWNRPQADAKPALERGGPIFAGEYASPEQWFGQQPARTSDVYSLGVLLYRLLTGTSPQNLQGLTPAEARRRVQRGSIQPASSRVRTLEHDGHAKRCSTTARQLAGQLSGDLDRILAKALAADPDKRYASPRDFREDLDRHLEGQPIRARGPAPIYVLGRSLRRYRWPLALFLSVVGVLAWALRLSISSSREAEGALVEARIYEARAEELGQRLRQLCVQLLTELGPSMQGQPGLEDARRYLLSVGAPLLDQLRGTGHEDHRLAMHICRSYVELAEADFASLDTGGPAQTSDAADKSLALCSTWIAGVPAEYEQEAGEYYARAVRAAAWFAELSLDESRGRAIIEGIPQQLAAAGLVESKMDALAQLALGEARRTYHASQLNFDRALGAWDLERLRTIAATDATVSKRYRAEEARVESIRALDLIEAGRSRDALPLWRRLAGRLHAEVSSQPDPKLSLLGLETHAWLELARVCSIEGENPGPAFFEIDHHLSSIRTQFAREPGAQWIVADAELGLGSCKLPLGTGAGSEALAHLDRAANALQQILDRGSRWPLLYLRLAETHRLRARALSDAGRQELARQALACGERALLNLPPHATPHIQVLALECGLQLERIRQQAVPDAAKLESLLEGLATLRLRGASPYVVDCIGADLTGLRQFTRAAETDGVRSK